MNTIFGYKVLKGDVSGFPDTSINKVVNTLEDAKISYQIIDVDKDPLIKDRSIKWLCKCDCGNEVAVSGSNLRTGHTQSCGCL